jgi:hypothetical protein
LAQPFGDRFDGQRAGLRCGDFDRQGDTVELLADPRDRQNIRVGEREIQLRLRRAVCEQLNRSAPWMAGVAKGSSRTTCSSAR